MTSDIAPLALEGSVEARIRASPKWLASRRRSGWEAFTALPWPSSHRDEDWRRTDIGKLDPARFAPDTVPSQELDAVVETSKSAIHEAAPGAAIVVCDEAGRVSMSGTDRLIAQGIIVCSLEEAAVRHPHLVQRALTGVPAGETPLIALWNGLWRGGCFIHVPASTVAATPLWVIHASASHGAGTYPATVALVDDDAALAVNELHLSPADGGAEILSVAVAAFRAGRDARIDHCLLQGLGPEVWHLATTRHDLGAGAQLRFFGATFGSRLQKAYWDAVLDGQGAEAQLSGIVLGAGTQHLDHQSLQAHRAPDTTSRLLLKVAVTDHARSVYSGLIDVDKEAQRTDGYVQNRNLILGHGAKADSIPRLEIRAHDVKCGHGATAGHIDDDQRFYLRSRGVPADEADRIIVRAFFDDAVAQVPDAGFAALVANLLDERLGRGLLDGGG